MTLQRPNSGTLNESTNVGVKTGRSRVGGTQLWILDQWGTRDKGDDVYPGSCPLEEVKHYVLLDYIEVYRMITESSTTRSDELTLGE